MVWFSLAGSVAFHGLLFFLCLKFILLRPETRKIVIGNVDLIMQEKAARAQAGPARNKIFKFLKLALPQITRPAAPEMPALDIKTPESRRRIFELPQKLSEREGKLKVEEKLDMAGSRRAASAIKDAALVMAPERGQAALAPKIELEEVGLKKAPKLPENLKFDDESREAVRPRDMAELDIAIRRAASAAAAPQALSGRAGSIIAPHEAARAIPAAPERLPEARQAKEAAINPRRAQPVISASALLDRAGGLKTADEGKKKIKITGPLSKRKILRYYAPPFPAWARERGLLEAVVALKFYVDNLGRVLDTVTVESSSGYGALDRLAVEAIKQWAFEPLDGPASNQWGVITFRFVN